MFSLKSAVTAALLAAGSMVSADCKTFPHHFHEPFSSQTQNN